MNNLETMNKLKIEEENRKMEEKIKEITEEKARKESETNSKIKELKAIVEEARLKAEKEMAKIENLNNKLHKKPKIYKD
jgi:hypothetical protein